MLALACDPRTAKTCTCTSACEVYRTWTEIRSRQGSQAGAMTELAQISAAAGRVARRRRRDPREVREHERPEREEDRGPGAVERRPDADARRGGGTAGLRRPAAPSGPAPTRRKLSKKEVAGADRARAPEVPRLPGARGRHHHGRRASGLPADRRGLREGQVHRGLLEAAVASTRRACARTSSPIYMQRYQMALETFHNMNGERAKMVLLSTARPTPSSRSTARTSTCRSRSGSTSGSRS